MTDKLHNPDWFRNLLAFFLISAFVGVVPLLIYKPIPAESKEVFVYIIGQLSGMATTALAFYFTQKAGQDALDNKRAEATGKMADTIATATAAALAPAPPPPPADIVEAVDQVAGAAADRAEEIQSGQ